jgi:hypothetical protein
MRKFNVWKVWIPALVLAVAMVGCSDPDKNSGSATSPLTPPTVVSVLPVGASTPCPTTLVSATFSKPMNPATINTSTFTVTPGVTATTITGDATNTTFTFTPSSALTVGTQYTATITAGARDQFGVALAADFTWTFTPKTCPGGISTGAACSFGILAGSTVTNTGPTNVTGDVGVWAGTAITGFPPGTATGGFFTGPGPGKAMTAQGALTTAYNNAAGATSTRNHTGVGLGGETLPAGVYTFNTSADLTGNLTLDGNGDPNAVFIFQIGSTLTTAAGSVNLIGLAQSKNVIWQVGTSATLGTNTTLAGNIMANASITLNTGATLNGRALARIGAVTLASNQVNVPPCP